MYANVLSLKGNHSICALAFKVYEENWKTTEIEVKVPKASLKSKTSLTSMRVKLKPTNMAE